MFALYPKRLGGNGRIVRASVNLGSTRGIGSVTRIVNFCQRPNSGCQNIPYLRQ